MLGNTKGAKKPVQEKYKVIVEWINPRTHRPAPSNRMGLSLPEMLQTWTSFSNDDGEQNYYFDDLDSAQEFVELATKQYADDPQYFVLNNDGELEKDEDGDPIVAWVPSFAILSYKLGAPGKQLFSVSFTRSFSFQVLANDENEVLENLGQLEEAAFKAAVEYGLEPDELCVGEHPWAEVDKDENLYELTLKTGITQQSLENVGYGQFGIEGDVV